jgi:hypothetical protein
MDYKNKELKSKINSLVDRDFNILQIKSTNENESLYFIVQNFEPPQINTVSSLPFLSFSGIEISEFLGNNVYNQSLDEYYLMSFLTFMETNKEYLYKFSDLFTWIFYSKK